MAPRFLRHFVFGPFSRLTVEFTGPIKHRLIRSNFSAQD
jgi:hypothetical protein